ncbi:MAG: type II toxin-antitoxin system VapB family antitoxin [Bacteroidetes bacterium]|nr:type II toxin-antitoxin system VapB family antitoxin [Fibrella sp.]
MTIELNDELVERALRLSDAKTQKEVVEQALESFVRLLQRQLLLTLREPGTWEGDLEHMRTNTPPD